MRRHACRIKRRSLAADCNVSALCINLSKTAVPAAHRRAEQSRTFCVLPGNLNFKVVDECVRACVWTWSPLCLASSPKLHFLFHNSEHLLDGFLKRTRPPKPCQISAHSVRRTRVLSDWLHFELFFPPPCCQPLCSISNLAFKKRLRNGTKFNQPSSVLHNKARAEFRTHFIYLSWTDPDRCACTTGHFILRLLLLLRIEWMGWFSFSSN